MMLQYMALNILWWQYVCTVPAVQAYYLSPSFAWRWM